MTAARGIEQDPPADAGNLPNDDRCDAVAGSPGSARLCWLAPDHEGPHWDDVDKEWWVPA